jgi:hypothetical protein
MLVSYDTNTYIIQSLLIEKGLAYKKGLGKIKIVSYYSMMIQIIHDLIVIN